MSGLRERLAELADEWQRDFINWKNDCTHHVALRAALAEDETPATPDDVQALAEVLHEATPTHRSMALTTGPRCSCPPLARAVLASDWLAEHDERIAMDAYERGLLDPGSAWMRANAEELAAARREGADAALAPVEALDTGYNGGGNQHAYCINPMHLRAGIAQGRDAAKGGDA